MHSLRRLRFWVSRFVSGIPEKNSERIVIKFYGVVGPGGSDKILVMIWVFWGIQDTLPFRDSSCITSFVFTR